MLVHAHTPVNLSLVVLQPCGEYEIDTSDLEQFYPKSDLPNGTADDDDYDDYSGGYYGAPTSVRFAGTSKAGTIVRSRDVLSLGGGRSVRVLMTEPVSQGLVDADTRVVLATRPEIPEEPEESGSVAPSHRSLVEEFDPDAFLSSSLALSLERDDGENEGLEAEVSTNSGSLTPRPGDRPLSPVAAPDDVLQLDAEEGGMAFVAVPSAGPSGVPGEEDVCYAGVWALGRAGVFEGDWVLLKAANGARSRLCRVVAWERLDSEDAALPPNALLVPPSVQRALLPSPSARAEVIVSPTPFGAREPTLPTARSMTLARVATAEGMDKRYERSWIVGLKRFFAGGRLMVRRGDVISVPVWVGRPLPEGEDVDDSYTGRPTALAYFVVTAMNFEPLSSLEEDFSCSVASKARAGELGCWADAGPGGDTALVLAGAERARVTGRGTDLVWHGLHAPPPPFAPSSASTLRDLVRSAFSSLSLAKFPLSVLVKGARGAGKRSLVHAIGDELGLSIVEVPCYDIVGDTPQVTEGTLRAKLDKARACAPAILLLTHLEAFAPASGGASAPKPPPAVKVLEDILTSARQFGAENGVPLVLAATTSDSDKVPRDMLAVFKHEIAIAAPNATEREAILTTALGDTPLAPDVSVSHVAAQAAALSAGDLVSLVERARDVALKRAASALSPSDALLAGVQLTAADLTAALGDARSSYADSIGAPKIPNVSWDDVGGLAAVKQDILDTVQLPLEHPELFGDGMKKRSGILLYGPPGTGKTLLAKAVATSCAANFLSVKGPELLNMYIGESEANVRRVFEKARDASPCVVFMDELDSVAPKRGQQGDSGGVMDRIVSQLLAELDGMSGGRGQVIVMAATNRPDLLDPALLRPGRFDRMLYLSVPETHKAQADVLRALTRKFTLDPDLNLDDLSERLPFTYTGADLYALCADAMLRAMTRAAEAVDAHVAHLDNTPLPRAFPKPLTPQYYLASMAQPEELEVIVREDNFVEALEKLQPSVSREEMEHYRQVQQQFKSFEIGQ